MSSLKLGRGRVLVGSQFLSNLCELRSCVDVTYYLLRLYSKYRLHISLPWTRVCCSNSGRALAGRARGATSSVLGLHQYAVVCQAKDLLSPFARARHAPQWPHSYHDYRFRLNLSLSTNSHLDATKRKNISPTEMHEDAPAHTIPIYLKPDPNVCSVAVALSHISEAT